MMAHVPGVGWKPLRDCSDEEVHAIARYHSQRGALRLFDEDCSSATRWKPARKNDTRSRVWDSSRCSDSPGLNFS
jgi:hypothetical protein